MREERVFALLRAILGMMVVFPAVAGAVDVPVFILAGQSNMDGRGQTSDIAWYPAGPERHAVHRNDKVEISYNGYQSSGSFAWM